MHETLQPGNQKHKSRKKVTLPPVLLSQDPTVCQTLNRTTQAPTVPGHSKASVLGKDQTMRPLFADIPPVSTRRRTYVCATGVLLTTPTHPHT